MRFFYWLFDKLYPLIRWKHERFSGNAWFSRILPNVWLGGAPTYERDFDFIKQHDISALVDLRAEREVPAERLATLQLDYLRLPVPDIGVPSAEYLDAGTRFIRQQVEQGHNVIVHCAKGRGRSATVLAAYLMRYEGLSYAEARAELAAARPLVNLSARHQRALEAWIEGSAEPGNLTARVVPAVEQESSRLS